MPWGLPKCNPSICQVVVTTKGTNKIAAYLLQIKAPFPGSKPNFWTSSRFCQFKSQCLKIGNPWKSHLGVMKSPFPILSLRSAPFKWVLVNCIHNTWEG